MELETYLLSAFEQNEALGLDDREDPDQGCTQAPHPAGRGGSREASDRHEAWLQNQPAPESTLHELVEEQLTLHDLDEPLRAWCRFVIGALDASGYLSTPDETLLAQAAELGFDGGPRELGRAIALVQSLEPRGIGGRNAVEALLLQLDPGDPDYAVLCLLIEDFLEDVARNKLPAVARAMDLSQDDLTRLLERLRELDLRPAAGFGGEAAPAIRPEVFVDESRGGYEVHVDSHGLPAVRIDPTVRRLSRDHDLDPEVRKHLRGRIDQARWLLGAIEQRRETLQRVAAALFAHQEPFLRHGPERLRPLRMGAVADGLGFHVSTVSRAVAGKHAQTPWGIFPLRWFFQAGSPGEGDSADLARDRARDLVREIIAGEDLGAPLSDAAVVARLSVRGHRLARRTVAKYREELGIPSSYRRRRFE
jgi:RNA polymerase sigma-54 factor